MVTNQNVDNPTITNYTSTTAPFLPQPVPPHDKEQDTTGLNQTIKKNVNNVTSITNTQHHQNNPTITSYPVLTTHPITTNTTNGPSFPPAPTNQINASNPPQTNTNTGGTAQAQQANSVPITSAHRYWKLAASESHQPHRLLQ